MKKLRQLGRVKNLAFTAWKLLRDKRMPRINKIVFLGLALVYLILPTDIISDFIPVLGWADDLLVLTVLLRIFIWSAPSELKPGHLIDVQYRTEDQEHKRDR